MSEIEDNAKVTILGGDDPVFPAYVLDLDWKGWAVPSFTKEVAQQVMDWTNKLAAEGRGDETAHWKDDNIILVDPVFPDKPLTQTIEPDKHGRYGIGAMAWCWSKVPGNEDDA